MSRRTDERLEELCSEGDAFLDADQCDKALKCYLEAADLIPEPKEEYPASTWVFSAIGDAFFFKKQYEKAIKSLRVAVSSPDGLGNPFIHLRLGEAYFELGKETKAADELTRAYMGAGEDIFENEDKKYFKFLRTKIILDKKKPRQK